MAILSTVLLFAYGAHVVLVLWHGHALGANELAYIVPMCICLCVVWIWQSRHIPKYQDASPLAMPRHSVSGVELDELIEQHRLDDEIEAQRRIAEREERDQEEQRFLKGNQEWQARQRWIQEGR